MPDQGSIEVAPSKRILDFKFQNEQDVRDVVAAAAAVCGAQFSTISVVHDQHQYYFYNQGFATNSVNRDHSICSKVQQGDNLVVIENLESVPNIPAKPLGNSYPKIHFYAGLPLRSDTHEVLGYLCVYHDKAIKLTDVQRSLLITLSRQLVNLFEEGKILSKIDTKLMDVEREYIRRESVFNSAHMVTLLLDKSFSVVECHPLLSKLIYQNLQREIKVGDDIRAYLGDATRSDFLNNFKRALDGQSISVQTSSGICWGGLNSFCHFSPAYDNQGELIGVYYHALPIVPEHTNDPIEKRDDRQLQWINDLQSHRFRGPLSSILGITQIWKELGNTPSSEEIDMILQAANKLDREIQRVLFDFSKHSGDLPNHLTTP